MTEPQRNEAIATRPDRDLVADLTSAALAVAAPEEVEAFAANREGFLDGRLATTSKGDDQLVGIGVEVIGMLTPYVVAAATAALRVIAAAVADSATAEAQGTVRRWIHGLLHHDPKEPAAEPLPADLLRRVHEITYDVVSQMGAPPADATLVSDAVAGRLATTPTQGEEPR